MAEHWAIEDREALAVVTLGAFALPDRSELVRRITTSYVPRRHLEGVVEEAEQLREAISDALVSLAPGTRVHSLLTAAYDSPRAGGQQR